MTELTKESLYLCKENECLLFSKEELQHSLLMLKKPEDICIHNLRAREFRQGIELVEDAVQNALRHEMQEIRRVREEMEKLENQVDLQLSKNDELKKKLKQNIVEKKSALEIDKDCNSLGIISSKIHNNSGCQVVINQPKIIFVIIIGILGYENKKFHSFMGAADRHAVEL